MAQAHAAHGGDKYYIPHGSKWPIIGSISLFITMLGVSAWLNGFTGPVVFYVGLALVAFMFFGWFGTVIGESQHGLYNAGVDRSFRMGMMWFIISEVMFFAAFFGVLFYARNLSVPWLGGEGSVINPKFNAPDGPICTALAESGALIAASADYKHSYPHSWRSKAKVIFRCTPQWFVPMDKATTDGTLRDKAMTAISDTRFIPEKGRNRLSSMVEGRPDWVLSRQRAWGVPITLFVKKGTNQYLNDAAVNARIIAGIREHGVDGWSDERAQEYLGSDYALADYERVTDILDVWFDSGCTHAFVLESGKWPDLMRPEGYTGPRADLYLEGSDQHRGWFQSSLLESCGRAAMRRIRLSSPTASRWTRRA